jgi:FkbM family methyltransferase
MRNNRTQRVQTQYPLFEKEYLEWIDVLESVEKAEHEFTMIELGAGYGKWLVRAALALRQRKPAISPFLIGVEAEPTHFQWMKIHFRDNGLDPDQHLLVQAAVAAEDGSALFLTGHSREWYGQSIVPDQWTSPPRSLRHTLAILSLRLHRKNDEQPWLSAKKTKVKTISLRSLLRSLRHVDLIHIDVQGVEYDVLKAAASEIDEKVKRIHIQTHGKETVGTHGKEVEKELRDLFGSLGWIKINDYPVHSKSATPYGEISFVDGVQTWLNPELR